MGANCGSFSEPNVANFCSEDVIGTGDTRDYELPNFCAPVNGVLGGQGIREDYCSRIGGGSEWEYQSQGSSCNYNDCNKHQKVSAGCCKGCCGITGKGVNCKRVSYDGDPLTCCFQEYNVKQEDSLCFMPGDTSKTCPPENRSMTSSSCRETLYDFCIGNDLGQEDTSWLQRWDTTSDQNCIRVLNRNLFGSNVAGRSVLSGGPIDEVFFTDIDGFEWSRGLITDAFSKYTSQGFDIGTLPGLQGYNVFENTLFKICESVPGVCQQGLRNVCVDQTTRRLLINREKVPWCGCYMPDTEYSRYVDQYQINKECTPICARAGNIKPVAPDGVTSLDCKQDACVIDDITIDLAQVDIANGISFSQFCGGCSGSNSDHQKSNRNIGSSSCLCIIDNLSIDAASSRIGGINLRQHCGTSPQCFRTNPDDSNDQLQVDCDNNNNFDPFQERQIEEEQNNRNRRIRFGLVLIGVVVISILVILLIWVFGSLGNNHRDKIYKRKTNVPSKTNKLRKELRTLERRKLRDLFRGDGDTVGNRPYTSIRNR